MTTIVGNYKKPIPGDILKTDSVVFVFEVTDDNIPSKSTHILDGKLILLLRYDPDGNYVILYNNKKYLYKKNTGRSFSGLYSPFSIVN